MMGQNAKLKAQRRVDRITQRMLGDAPTTIKVGLLSKDERKTLQKQRDLALAQARRNYRTAVAQIHQQYGQLVLAALAKKPA